jgi:SulP family sulfate permease
VATYTAIVLHMAQAGSGSALQANSAVLTLAQLQTGLAAASLMYFMASALVALSGAVGLGRVFKMIPTPVTAGISNGSAMILLLLALGKVNEGGWVAGLIGLAMVVVFYAWALLQGRSTWAQKVPAVVLSIAIGVALTNLPLGALAAPAGAGITPSGLVDGVQWASCALWSVLDTQGLGSMLMQGLPAVVTLALVMVLETFTTTGVMETRFGVRTHADRELVSLGLSNMLGACIGALPCTGSTTLSFASWLAGGRGRTAAWVCFALSGGSLVVFNAWFMAIPAGLAVGLLVLQAQLMVNPGFLRNLWGIVRTRRWKKPGSQDLGFWITVTISLVGFFGNLVWACFAGVGLSCLAVLRRVSAHLLAHWVYLDAVRSRRVRAEGASDALLHLAHHVAVLRLTGHLFFGNSARITQLADELHEDCVCAVIDASLVQDADPSGLDAIAWLVRTLQAQRIRVVVSGLAKTRVAALRDALSNIPTVEYRVDLDRGLEWCEDWVLQHCTALTVVQTSLALPDNTLLKGLADDEITAVLMVAELRQVEQGEALFKKDEPSDGVWLLQSGQVSILAGGGVQASRLATFGPGQFVGEMGFIDGQTRSATAAADTTVHAALLDNRAIAALVRDHPQAALKITQNIARELSHRVRTTSAVLAQEGDAPVSVWEASVHSVAVR